MEPGGSLPHSQQPTTSLFLKQTNSAQRSDARPLQLVGTWFEHQLQFLRAQPGQHIGAGHAIFTNRPSAHHNIIQWQTNWTPLIYRHKIKQKANMMEMYLLWFLRIKGLFLRIGHDHPQPHRLFVIILFLPMWRSVTPGNDRMSWNVESHWECTRTACQYRHVACQLIRTAVIIA